MVDDTISDEDLSGPVIDRRTTMKLMGVAGTAGLAGCAGGSNKKNQVKGTGTEAKDGGGSKNKKHGGRLQAGWNTGSLNNISPTWITIGINAQVMANVHNALVQTTPGLKVVPDLAKDWEVENKTKYTFHLREGVKFHNGTEFTAEDVKYTIAEIFRQNSPIKPKMSPLKKWDEGGVVVVDDYTVELNFEKPYGPAITTLARGDGRGSTIINKEAVEEMGWKQYKLTPVGTGPFKVRKHEPGSGVILDRFEDYFQGYWAEQEGAELPYLDGVTINPIPDPTSRVNALRGGDIDFMNLVPVQNLSTVKKANNVTVKSGPGGGYNGLVLNGSRDMFKDPKVRQGITKMVDQKKFVQDAYFGNQHVADGPIAPAHSWAFREDKPPYQDYNPEEGKKLLKEAGAWPPSFSIMTDKGGLRSAKVMRSILNDQGFDVSVEQVTSATYIQRLKDWDYETVISGNAVDLDPDPALYLFFMPKELGGSINFWGYDPRKNSIPEAEKIIDLFQKQRSTVNRDKRAKYLQEAEDLLMEDAPFAFTHHYKPWVAYSNSVKGYMPHPVNRDFHTVWLDE